MNMNVIFDFELSLLYMFAVQVQKLQIIMGSSNLNAYAILEYLILLFIGYVSLTEPLQYSKYCSL